ncbi:hypothetical protein NUW54_g10781 [Trametes sanguinea]|uniref:Uncharacterized protein n=1 Tax=Trametes sanguinea TaxID=158606 RepID=A0ACC1NTR8_9APHY|nr:hypothetical protein NUW54_g10781 [Trametes sanguinea]
MSLKLPLFHLLSHLSIQERRGKGALQSHYLLKLLAPHLKIIQQSALEESPLPAGAMCLSCAALEITFQAYQTGAYKKPTEKFNEENGGERCDGFYADIVQPQLLEHPEQFTALLEKANRHSTGASTSTRRVSKRSRRMMDSSPVREE